MPKRKFSAIPIDPNESGPDPQFGELSDLPRGVKRQTSILTLGTMRTTDPKAWARLVYSFPECLGIKETLDNAAKSSSCIPSVSMDVPINLPVIKNIQVDEISVPANYGENLVLTDSSLDNTVYKNNRAYIFTGEDQLTKTAPDVDDETKEVTVMSYAQYAALSDTIYAKFTSFPDAKNDAQFAVPIEPAGWKGTGWLYGKSVGGVSGIDYKDVALRYLQPSAGPNNVGSFFEVNNIQSKGHLLLKDHVNLFIQTDFTGSPNLQLRVIIDYTTREVSLSSLLVWQQQLTEFLPKQVRWRAWEQTFAADKNGWNILVSRGVVKENGTGDDPTDKTAFPEIKD